jgi:hypothetical protein
MQLKTTIFFIVLAVMGYLTVINFDQVAAAFTEHFTALIYTTFITFIGLAIQTYNFLQLLQTDREIPYLQALHTWGVSNLANYLGPFQPGLAVRMVYFKSIGVPVKSTTHASLRQLLLSVWIATGLAVVGLFSGYTSIKLFAVFGITAFILMPLVLKVLRLSMAGGRSDSRFITIVRSVLDLGKIGMPPYRLWSFIAQYVLGALVLYGVYQMFDIPLKLHEAMLLSVIFMLSGLFSVTPNNLGTQELLIGYVAHLGGASGGVAFSMALLFRVAHVIACLTIIALTYRHR